MVQRQTGRWPSSGNGLASSSTSYCVPPGVRRVSGKSAEATATGSLVVNGVQFIGGFTSAGIVQESTGSVDIQKK